MKVVSETDSIQAGIGSGFWEHYNLIDKLSIQLEGSRSGGGGQRGEGNVNCATHLLEKLGRSPAMPSTTGQDSGGGNSNTNLVIPCNEDSTIRAVWNHNLYEEFRTIRNVIHKYTYVAMDTEFPGVVARPIGEFRSTADYEYQLMRCNVDLLQIIQLGLTFFDENGKPPSGYTTWQFNFKFKLSEDMYAQDSIDLLQNSGIQFKKHEEDGIDPLEFAALLITSGVVLMENIKWLSLHSAYDFGYLIKLLTDAELPQDESDFFELLRLYFPTLYKLKTAYTSLRGLPRRSSQGLRRVPRQGLGEGDRSDGSYPSRRHH